ncbi:M16 family metallopeptidase, partial [Candidatus Auribacterota bacterium]
LEDTGYFSIYTAVPPDKADKVVDEILRQVKKIRAKGITDEELLYAKARFKGNLLRRFESNLSIARIHGIEVLLKGHYEPFEETTERIERVGKNDIIRAAKRYFSEKKAVIIAVGG